MWFGKIQNLSKEEKDMVFWSTAIHNGTLSHISDLNTTIAILKKNEPNEPGKDGNALTLMPKFGVDEAEIRARARIVKMIPIERLFESEKFQSVDNIVLAYKYFADHKYLKENPEISDFGGRDTNAERVFLDFLINTLQTKSLSESIEFFKTLELQNIKIFELIGRSPDMSGVLVQQISDAVEKEAVGTIPFEDLIRISRWIANPFLQNAFQRYCKDLYWDKQSFEKKLELLGSYDF